MKEKIITKIKNVKKTYVAAGAVALVVVIVLLALLSSTASTAAESITTSTATSTLDRSSLVGIVGSEASGSDQTLSSRNSWPAEIVSSAISNIQPQREGIITEWNVRIGDEVSEGQTLGRISAPPATPELVKMLAEGMEASAAAQAKAQAARSYLSATSTDAVATGLGSLRENENARERALRSFLERSLTKHVALVTYFQSWKDVKYGSFSMTYGSYNQNLRADYEEALVKLVEKMKVSASVPVSESERYFDVATKLVWGSVSDGAAYDFQTAVKDDQKDFYTMLSDYREAQAEASDKAAEYSQMIREADASTQAYEIVKEQITSGSSIVAPRSGIISAIYGKVGDLVKPDMAVAVIAGSDDRSVTVRMHIPNNIRKPLKGEILSVVRPGFADDSRKVKIVGTGLSLDSTGSYMADAEFIDQSDWPIGSSVRVIASQGSESILIPTSALWWSKDGIPHVWIVSPADRVFAKNIKIGRTLGSSVEVYEGLKKGDRYVTTLSPSIHEDVMISDIVGKDSDQTSPTKPASSSGHGSMPGMEM